VTATLLDLDESIALLAACPPRLRILLFQIVYVSAKLCNLTFKLCFKLELLLLRLQICKLLVKQRYLLIKIGLVRWCRIHNFLC